MLLIVQLIAELLPCVAARSSHITWVVKNNYENVLHEREMEAEREREGERIYQSVYFSSSLVFSFFDIAKDCPGLSVSTEFRFTTRIMVS